MSGEMTEIKQLLANRFLRRSVFAIIFVVLTLLMVVVSHPYWQKHWSWVELALWVIFFQSLCLLFLGFLRWIPWRKGFLLGKMKYRHWQEKRTLFFLKKRRIHQDIKILKSLLRRKKRGIFRWLPFRLFNAPVPWFFGFSAENDLDPEDKNVSIWTSFLREQKAWEELPFRLPALAEDEFRPYEIRVFEQGVLILISGSQDARSDWAWRYFLRQIRSSHHPKSSVVGLILSPLNIRLEKKNFLAIRQQWDTAINVWGQILPIYGIIPGWEKVSHSMSLSVSRLDWTSKSAALEDINALVKAYVTPWESARLKQIESKDNKLACWTSFLEPSLIQETLETILVSWRSFLQSSSFFLPSALKAWFLLRNEEPARTACLRELTTLSKWEQPGEKLEKSLPKSFGWLKWLSLGIFLLALGGYRWDLLQRLHELQRSYQTWDEQLFDEEPEFITWNHLVPHYQRYRDIKNTWIVHRNFGWLSRQQELAYYEDYLGQLIYLKLKISVHSTLARLIQLNAHWSSWLPEKQNLIAPEYFADLKKYLILTGQTALPSREQAEQLRLYLKPEIFDGDPKELNNLLAWFQSQSNPHGFRAYVDVIEDARKNLSQVSGLPLFKAELGRWEQEADVLRLEDIGIANQGWLTSKTLLKTIYTQLAWKNKVLPWIEARTSGRSDVQWVLGNQDRPFEKKQLVDFYGQQYARAWSLFMEGLTVKRTYKISEGVQLLEEILEPDSVWFKLMDLVAQECGSDLSVDGKKIGEFLGSKLTPEKEVSKKSQYQQNLAEVKTELEGLIFSPSHQIQSEHYLAQIMTEPAVGKNSLSKALEGLVAEQRTSRADGIYRRLLEVLKAPLLSVVYGVIQEGLSGIQEDWHRLVTRFDQELAHKFPFKEGPDEVTLSEFSEFFNPKNGLMTRFIANRLNPYIKRTSLGLTTKTWMGIALPLKVKFLNNVHQIETLAYGFFKDASEKIALDFQILPKPSPQFSDFSLESNGQQYSYRNDPEEWKMIAWPGQTICPKAKISATLVETKKTKTLSFRGEWALFRLLRAAQCRRSCDGNYWIQFQFPGRLAQAALNSDEVVIFQFKTDAAKDIWPLLVGKEHFQFVQRIY